MDFFSPQAVTGLNPGSGPSTGSTTAGHLPASAASAGPSGMLSQASALSPQHPLFWAGLLIFATYGLIGLNSAFHIGPFKASVGVGR